MDDQIALKYSCIIFAVTAIVLFVLYLFLRSGNRKIFQRIRKFSSESYLLSDEWKKIYQKNKNKFPFKTGSGKFDSFLKKFSDTAMRYSLNYYLWLVAFPVGVFLTFYCCETPLYFNAAVSAASACFIKFLYPVLSGCVCINPYTEFKVGLELLDRSRYRMIWAYIIGMISVIVSDALLFYFYDIPLYACIFMISLSIYIVVRISLVYKSLLSDKPVSNRHDGAGLHQLYEKIHQDFAGCKYIAGSKAFICFGGKYIIFGNTTGVIAVGYDELISISRVIGSKMIVTKDNYDLTFYKFRKFVYSADIKFKLTETGDYTPLPPGWASNKDNSSGECTVNLEFKDYEVEMIIEEFCRIRGLSYADSLLRVEKRDFADEIIRS